MKKLFITAALILFVIVTKAQQPPPPPSLEERLKRATDIIQNEVKPTAAQKSAIENAFKAFLTAADKLRKDNPPPPPPPPDPKVKEAMDKLVKERDEAIKKILTADQYEKYKEAAKKLHPPKPGDKGGNKPPPPPSEQ